MVSVSNKENTKRQATGSLEEADLTLKRSNASSGLENAVKKMRGRPRKTLTVVNIWTYKIVNNIIFRLFKRVNANTFKHWYNCLRARNYARVSVMQAATHIHDFVEKGNVIFIRSK